MRVIPLKIPKIKLSRWICASPLDLGNKVPSGVINDALWASKHQKQLWGT